MRWNQTSCWGWKGLRGRSRSLCREPDPYAPDSLSPFPLKREESATSSTELNRRQHGSKNTSVSDKKGGSDFVRRTNRQDEYGAIRASGVNERVRRDKCAICEVFFGDHKTLPPPKNTSSTTQCSTHIPSRVDLGHAGMLMG